MKIIRSAKSKLGIIALILVFTLLGCVAPTTAHPVESTESTTEATTMAQSINTEPSVPATEQTVPPNTEVIPPTTTPASTEPVYTEPVPTEPKPTEPRPTEAPEPVYTPVEETVYASGTVNIRVGPGTEYDKVGSLKFGNDIQRVGIGDNGWSQVVYESEIRYIHSSYLVTEKPVPPASKYPMTYSDSTCTITITREWKYNAWCYIAHLEFTDYSRFASSVAKNNRGSSETTSSAARRQNAIFCVNGPYNWGELKNAYAIIRNGVVYNDISIAGDLGIYNANTGVLAQAGALGINGMLASEAAAQGLATDTFKFWNSTLVANGVNQSNPDNDSRAQRTFIATTGQPGDIYVIVAEGRYADGESAGLTKYECAKVVLDLGCTYGVMLDGGGSSTMYFNGKVLNSAAGNERSLVDFVYLRKE